MGKGTGNTKALQFRRGGEKRARRVGVERVIGGQPGEAGGKSEKRRRGEKGSAQKVESGD